MLHAWVQYTRLTPTCPRGCTHLPRTQAAPQQHAHPLGTHFVRALCAGFYITDSIAFEPSPSDEDLDKYKKALSSLSLFPPQYMGLKKKETTASKVGRRC